MSRTVNIILGVWAFFILTAAIKMVGSADSAGEVVKVTMWMSFIMVIGFCSYFLPWLIAWKRHHHNSAAIFMVNLFLGWTFLGWVVALVWASTRVEAKA